METQYDESKTGSENGQGGLYFKVSLLEQRTEWTQIWVRIDVFGIKFKSLLSEKELLILTMFPNTGKPLLWSFWAYYEIGKSSRS